MSRMQSVPQLQVDALSVYGRMIEYFVNPDEMILMEKTSETLQTVAQCLSAALSFKPGNTELLSAYSGNRIEAGTSESRTGLSYGRCRRGNRNDLHYRLCLAWRHNET